MPIPVLLHLSLMALMMMLCISAVVKAWKRSGAWLPGHRLLGILGASSGLIGVGIMGFEKIEHGYPHFASLHAILGLMGGLLLILVPLLGLLGVRGLNSLRGPHRVLARLMIVLGASGLLTGLLYFI